MKERGGRKRYELKWGVSLFLGAGLDVRVVECVDFWRWMGSVVSRDRLQKEY